MPPKYLLCSLSFQQVATSQPQPRQQKVQHDVSHSGHHDIILETHITQQMINKKNLKNLKNRKILQTGWWCYLAIHSSFPAVNWPLLFRVFKTCLSPPVLKHDGLLGVAFCLGLDQNSREKNQGLEKNHNCGTVWPTALSKGAMNGKVIVQRSRSPSKKLWTIKKFITMEAVRFCRGMTTDNI